MRLSMKLLKWVSGIMFFFGFAILAFTCWFAFDSADYLMHSSLSGTEWTVSGLVIIVVVLSLIAIYQSAMATFAINELIILEGVVKAHHMKLGMDKVKYTDTKVKMS